MELIATARFKKAMDRATAATDYTSRITRLVGDLAASGLEVSHPLLEARSETKNVAMLVLTAVIVASVLVEKKERSQPESSSRASRRPRGDLPSSTASASTVTVTRPSRYSGSDSH